MKVFRDYSQPFRRRRTRSKKLGVICSVVFVACLCVSSAVSERSSSNSSSKSVSDFPNSGKVMTTNFASLKNHTFKIGASKKYYLKYAASTTTTSTTTTEATTTTRATKSTTTAKPSTSKTTTVPTVTRTTSDLPPPPPPTPLVPPSQKTVLPDDGAFGERQNVSKSLSEDPLLPEAQPLIQELDMDIPDQIAMGSDHFMNVLAPPSSVPFTGADQRIDGGGFMSPSASGNLPASYEKFGVQDSLVYKNGIGSSAPAVAGPSGAFGTSGGANFGPGGLSPHQHFVPSEASQNQNFGPGVTSPHQNFGIGGPSAHSNFGPGEASPNQNFGLGGAPQLPSFSQAGPSAPNLDFGSDGPSLNQNFSPGGPSAHSNFGQGGLSPQQNYNQGGPSAHSNFGPGGLSPQQNFIAGGPSANSNFGSVGLSSPQNFGGNSQTNFGGTGKPARLATTFQQSGGYTGGNNFNNLHHHNVPPQPTSGGAYQFPSGGGSTSGLHEINPYAGNDQNLHNSPNPNVQTFSPYSTLVQNQVPNNSPQLKTNKPKTKSKHSKKRTSKSSHYHGTNNANNANNVAFPTSMPSAPSNFPTVNSVPSYTQPQPTNWQPTTPRHHRGPVYPGHGSTTRRNDKQLNHNQIEKSDEDNPTESSQMESDPQFGSPNDFGPSGSPTQVPQDNPSFLGSFDAGDLPQVVDSAQQENFPQSPEEFEPSPPEQTQGAVPLHHQQGFASPQNNGHGQHQHNSPPGFNDFDSSSVGLSGIDGSQSHSPLENQQGIESDLQGMNLNGPALNEFNNHHAPQLNSPQFQHQHQPSSHKHPKTNGFGSLSSLEQGFGDFNGFTGSTIPLSESAQATSEQEDTSDGFNNFQGGQDQPRGPPQKFKGSGMDSTPQFPSPQAHFDIPQQQEGLGLDGFHNAPIHGPGQNSQPLGPVHQGFGDFSGVNGGQQHNAQSNGFNSGFGGFPGQGHDARSLTQPQEHNGFGGFPGNDASHPNHHSGPFNSGHSGNSLPGFQDLGTQTNGESEGSSEGGGDSEALGEVEREPPNADEQLQGEQGDNFGAVSEEGVNNGPDQHSQRQPSGVFGGSPQGNHGASPDHFQGHHQPPPGFAGFSNEPNHIGHGPSQHNSGQPPSNFGGFPNDPSNINGLSQHDSQGNSGFGIFPKEPTVLREQPSKPSKGNKNSGLNGFPGNPSKPGSSPNPHAHFEAFAGPNHVGPVPPQQHVSGQPPQGFGGFSGPNPFGPVPPQQHASGKPPQGFGGFSEPNHFGPGPPQQASGQPPQGFGGFPGSNHPGSPSPQHVSGKAPPGFGGFSEPNHFGSVPQQFTPGQPPPGFAGFSGPNHFGPPQHASGNPPQGFGGFFGSNHLGSSPPQHAPGQTPPGFEGFPESNRLGPPPPQHAPGPLPGFGGFSGPEPPQQAPGFGGFSGPHHPGPQPPQHAPGFGGFSGPNHPGPEPQHAPGQPHPGIEGYSETDHPGPPQHIPTQSFPGFGGFQGPTYPGSASPQHTPSQPPLGVGGFYIGPNTIGKSPPGPVYIPHQNQQSAPQQHGQQSFGKFPVGPNQQAPIPPQNVQNHPPRGPNNLASPQHSPGQQQHIPGDISVEEVHPGPPSSLKQSFNHASKGSSGKEAQKSASEQPMHSPQSHVSQTGPLAFDDEQSDPLSEHEPSHDSGNPGFDEDFESLKLDDDPEDDLHSNQIDGNMAELKPPLSHPPNHSPQIVNTQGPPQVVTFEGPPQVGLQDTEASASHSIEHSIEQQPPSGGPGPGFAGKPGFGPGNSPFDSHHGPGGRQHGPVDDLVKQHPGLGPDDSALVNVPGAGFVGELRPGQGSGPPPGSFRGGSPFGGPGPIGMGPLGPGISNSPVGGGHHGHHNKNNHKHPIGHHPGGQGSKHGHHKPGFGLGGFRNAILGPLKLFSGGFKKPLSSPLKFFGGVKPIGGPLKTFGSPTKPLGPVKPFGDTNGPAGFAPNKSPIGPIKNFSPPTNPIGPINGFGPSKNPVVNAPFKALGDIKHAVGNIQNAAGGPVNGFLGDNKQPLGPVKGFGVGIGHGGGPLKGFGLLKGLINDKGKFPLKHKLKYPLEKVIKVLLTLADKILSFYANLSIPKDHYIRVISFAGVYLLLGFLFKDSEHLLYPKCEKWGWNAPAEFTFHAPARFVPAVPVDQHMQQEFLDLFRGLENCRDEQVEKKKKKKKKKDKKHGKDNSSSEEEEDDKGDNDNDSIESDYRAEIDLINDKCPRGQFFYSMSPYHIEAWTTLARMFVDQKSPADVLHLARALLHDHSVNPKVWYLGLQAAAVERPDMTGFSLAHPIDALPDLFIPGHYIEGEMDRYRGLRVKRSALKQIRRLPTSNKVSKIIKIHKRTGILGVPKANITTTTKAPVILEEGYAPRIKSSRENTSTTTSAYDMAILNAVTSTYFAKPVVNISAPVYVKPILNAHPPTYYGKSTLSRERKGDEEEDDEDSDEDDEIDEDDDSDEKEGRRKKKHPLGYGHGSIGDGFGSYKDKYNGNNGGGGGGGNGGGLFGGLFGGNKKHKGKGKGKGKDEKKKKCIIVDGSVGLDNGIENKLWYWREDMMVNQHHFYWHQIYPVNATMHGDRRAELFFFMHRSMLARYNAERLSNGFGRTAELALLLGAPIEEGYNPHLKDFNSGSWWTPRPPHLPLSDIMHIHDPDYSRDIYINDVIGLYNNFVKAIKLGKLLTANGKFLPIRFHEGIQSLANTVEATNLSVNPFYYDAFGLHNLGHIMIGLAADPDYSKQLPSGVMGEAAVSMRDPSFYTYHTVLDNLFEKFKKTLPPYKPYGGVWPLQWHGVDVVDIKLVSHGGGDANHLTTFYIKHKFQLEPGVDRSIEKGIEKAEVCAVHLDHAPFQFQISIDRKKCAKSKSGQGTVRIFMAPRFNEEGHRLPLAEQRRLMFQLDAFQVELKVGRNLITRNSRDNALTKPWSRSLKEYERGPDPSGAADYCGCGWPHHLFIPKGSVEGMAFDLFVMVTNFDEDYVKDHPVDLEMPERCNSPYIFCGIPRRRYPDGRPMGYPFDRPPFHVPAKPCGHGYGFTLKDLLCKITGKFLTRPAATLEEYVSGATNMAMTVFEIKHIPKVVGKHYG